MHGSSTTFPLHWHSPACHCGGGTVPKYSVRFRLKIKAVLPELFVDGLLNGGLLLLCDGERIDNPPHIVHGELEQTVCQRSSQPWVCFRLKTDPRTKQYSDVLVAEDRLEDSNLDVVSKHHASSHWWTRGLWRGMVGIWHGKFGSLSSPSSMNRMRAPIVSWLAWLASACAYIKPENKMRMRLRT
jgi:hypothetical protein